MVTVKTVYNPTKMVGGAGVAVQRFLGYDTRFESDPFLLLDLFGSDNEKEFSADFPDHPHRGIETVTYMLKGQVTHTDSAGGKGTIGPGEVQWVTAGSGIIHSEVPHSVAGGVLGIQLWINLPQEIKMVKPTYRELKQENIPVIETTNSKVKIISGKYRKRDGGISDLKKPIDFFDIKLWPDSAFDEVISPDFRNYRYFLFVYEGQVMVQGYQQPIVAPSLVSLTQGTVIQLKSGADGAGMLMFGAEPNNEPIAWHGSIVMNTESEIQKALEEFRNGTFLKEQ